MLDEPLSPPEARRLIRDILRNGAVVYSEHALERMAKHGIERHEVWATLLGGSVEEGEWENGSWRYRVRSHRLTVVVAFDDETVVIVVSAWRTA